MSEKEVVADLRKAVGEFASVIASLSETYFLKQFNDWTPRDVVAHLIGWNLLYIEGCQKLLEGSSPFYHQDAKNDYANINAELILQYASRDRSQLLKELETSYQELRDFLLSIDPLDWEKETGVFHRGKPETIQWAVKALAGDYVNHGQQIQEWAGKLKFIDLSHTIEDGMITYKGLPGPVISDYWGREYSRQFYSEGTEFHVGKIQMVANTGTYIDSPFHRYADGQDLSELELSAIADLDGVVVRVYDQAQRAIGSVKFEGLDLKGKAVLVHTGWSAHWRTEQYFEGHPFLTAEGAQYLANSGAALVGIDSLNIDDTADRKRPAHTTLLGVGIPIIEHLRGLENLPDQGFRFFAVPVKVKGLGSFPVRAFAIV